MVTRQRLVLAAAASASAALLAACGPGTASPPAPTNGTTSPQPPGIPGYVVGAALVSNGSTTVTINGKPVTFPTAVSDAAWSHDGSRIAFIDGDGNIATARPDGTGVLVLTRKVAGVVRSSPTWMESDIVFTYRANGTAKLYRVSANGSGQGDGWDPTVEGEQSFDGAPASGNTAPSGVPVGKGVELAYQHTGSAGAEVWVVDTNQRVPYAHKLAAGSAPELSPDGELVAFVGTNGQISLLETKKDGAKAKQITFGVDAPSHLAWSPDGRGVGFQTAAKVLKVSTDVAPGATDNPTTELSAATGVPTFAPSPRDRVVRLPKDLVDASVAASQLRWIDQPEFAPNEGRLTAYNAIVTGAAGLANAGAATAGMQIGGYSFGPLLVTTGAGLDARVKAELRRALGKVVGQKPIVTIVGGPEVVTVQAEKDIKALGYDTTRIATDTVATTGLPETISESQEIVYVVDLDDAAGTATAVSLLWSGGPITLYSQGGTLAPPVRALLNQVGPKTRIIPLDTAAEQALSTSWSGKPSAFKVAPTVGTDAARLKAFGSDLTGVVVADRSAPADVVLATNLAIVMGYGVLVVDGGAALDPALVTWLSTTSGTVDTVTVVDSAGKLAPATVESVARALSGPLGFSEAVPTKAG